ncbi:hypothetical protein OGAPHI_001503 [Ogataea philodendri]|uniref:Uncharacterized protein n=1 Tax=Ogataea philodendri TaxID=1378263 RepID=A0A9P8PCK8_9ASCO|nr:uncharacterized protein OGAPHI_001503 [Ogataea philodendri]KAH3669382.1 hypothetical protein OGAPHI_001503 [Ogataea philodendri]
MLFMKLAIFVKYSGLEAPKIRIASRAALVALLMATVATGTPLGIWTIECSESTPSSVEPLTGTPITGSGVMAATIPGRWAAPPAPAMIHLTPLKGASCANLDILSGVLWAETMVTSNGTSNSFRMLQPVAMTGRSESEPMITLMSGFLEVPTTSADSLCWRAVVFPSMKLRRRSQSSIDCETILMCPSFRPGLVDLPYR